MRMRLLEKNRIYIYFIIRYFICKVLVIKKSLKYNIQILAIKILYLTMINQSIKNMSVREQMVFAGETLSVMWS